MNHRFYRMCSKWRHFPEISSSLSWEFPSQKRTFLYWWNDFLSWWQFKPICRFEYSVCKVSPQRFKMTQVGWLLTNWLLWGFPLTVLTCSKVSYFALSSNVRSLYVSCPPLTICLQTSLHFIGPLSCLTPLNQGTSHNTDDFYRSFTLVKCNFVTFFTLFAWPRHLIMSSGNDVINKLLHIFFFIMGNEKDKAICNSNIYYETPCIYD